MADRGNNDKAKETRIFWMSLVLAVIALVFMLLAFGTPYWYVQGSRGRFHGTQRRTFEKCGLWEMCLNNHKFTQDYQGKHYDGCWYVFAKEYEYIRHIVLPDWFIAVQFIASLTLLLEGIVVLNLILYAKRKCSKEYEVLVASCALLLICGMLITISSIIFGVRSKDRNWMPNPDRNYPSWSFALYVLSGFFSVFSGMGLLVSTKQYSNKYVT